MSKGLEAFITRAIMKTPAFLKRKIVGEPLVIDGQTLDLDMQFFIKLLAWAKQPPLETLPLEEARKIADEGALIVGGKMRPMKSVKDLAIKSQDYNLPLRIYYPFSEEAALPIVVFFHGGAGYMGSLDLYNTPCSYFAETAACVVVSVGYRLAPEFKFPTAVEDAITAVRWVKDNAEQFGADARRIALSGDSAGGNLAAVATAQLIDVPDYQPRAQFLCYPNIDFATRYPSRDLFNNVYIVNDDLIEQAMQFYLNDAEEVSDPRVTPLHADTLSQLPPTWVYTSGFDPLRDEGQAYAQTLKEAGVEVHSSCFKTLTHGFMNLIGVIPAACEAVMTIGRDMRHFFHGK